MMSLFKTRDEKLAQVLPLVQAINLPLAELVDPDNPTAKTLASAEWSALCQHFFQIPPQLSQDSEKVFKQAYTSLVCVTNIQKNAEKIPLKEYPYPYCHVLNYFCERYLKQKRYADARDYAQRYATIYLTPGHMACVTLYRELYLELVKWYDNQQNTPNMIEQLTLMIQKDETPYKTEIATVSPNNTEQHKLIIARWLLVNTKMHLELAKQLNEYSIAEYRCDIHDAGCQALLACFDGVMLTEDDQTYLTRQVAQQFADTGIIPGMAMSVAFQP